jgi:NitT/TauT family transport system substrate-binding protein
MVHEESPVHTFADLEGRTVAVRPGSTFFQYLLKRYDLKTTREIPATYSVANFLQDPNYIQQVFVTNEPYFARKGGAKVRTLLVSSTGYQPYRVFYTSRQFLAEHPDVVARFVQASLAGWRDFLANPAATEAVIHQANPAMSEDQMRFTVDALKSNHFVDGDNTPDSHQGHFTSERWATMYKQLVDLKVITHPIDPATAYTLQFAP